MTKDEALKMAYDWLNEYAPPEVVQACKDTLEQEERTQRTMYCGTADSFIAMDDDHKRRWFVQSLRESKRRKELEDILEQPAQEPIVIGIDFAKNQWKESMIKFLKEKQICAFDNNKIIMQSWIDELENKYD